MPTSLSPKAGVNAPLAADGARFLRPLITMIVLAVLSVAVIALPASLVRRFLPPTVHAEDFSGSLWHGSAGKLTVNSLDAGAIEWRIHPWPLLGFTLSTDLHWVKTGFVADGKADLDRRGLTLRNLQGGGPLEDLSELGVPAGWHGTASFKFSELKLRLGAEPAVLAAVGDLEVSDLAVPQIAAGADLGGYDLHWADGAIAPNSDAIAELTDTGGPLEIQAVIHFAAKDHTGLLSGTVKERLDAPMALRRELSDLARLHARDAEGRIPIDLEFTL